MMINGCLNALGNRLARIAMEEVVCEHEVKCTTVCPMLIGCLSYLISPMNAQIKMCMISQLNVLYALIRCRRVIWACEEKQNGGDLSIISL